jgi:hypothetical protein
MEVVLKKQWVLSYPDAGRGASDHADHGPKLCLTVSLFKQIVLLDTRQSRHLQTIPLLFGRLS